MSSPQPHDGGLLGWDGLSEMQRELFTEGCELFEDGRFWHAHESWGGLWKSRKPLGVQTEGAAVQGLVPVG